MVVQEVRHDISHIETINERINNFLSNDNFNKLQGIMRTIHVQAGNHLFWEGELVDKMYYIQSGRVKLRTSSESGKEFLLSIKEEGSLLGEIGGFNNDLHYSYRAEVSENAEIGVILLSDLKKLMYEFGNFAVEFMSWIGWSQRVTQNKLYDFLFYDKTGALASTIIKFTTTHGVKCAEGILISIELTNKDFGDFIGTSRESVNRVLNAWKREGVIEMIDRKIVIRRIDYLYDICDCINHTH